MKLNKLLYGLSAIGVMSILVGCAKEEMKLKQNEYTIEYGSTIQTDIKTYLDNTEDYIKETKLSGIPENESEKEYPAIGEYELTLKNNNQENKIKVIVKDTVAPSFKDIKESYEVAYGKKFDVKNIKAEDLSTVEYTLDDSKVNYKKAGTYDATVIAKDSSDNESKRKIRIKIIQKKENDERNLKDDLNNNSLNKKKVNKTEKHTSVSDTKNQTHRINISCILQNPELPSGCEVTSLTMALNYNGYSVDKLTLADNFLPKGEVGKTDYNIAFVGNPRNNSSFGCYAPVIVSTANKYLNSVGSSKKAVNVTGSELENLFKYIDQDIPVVIWATNRMKAPYISRTWYVDGKELSWKSNEHCLLLTGYDKNKNVVYTADPLRGNITYDLNLFNQRYIQMGMQGVIIK